MINAVVVDHDLLAAQRLNTLLSAIADIHLVQVIGDHRAAIAALCQAHPAVVFVNPEMTNPSLAELSAALDYSRTPLVITTPHVKHAVRAFDLGATDFLLAPVTAERLIKCMAKVRRFLRSWVSPDHDQTASGEDAIDLGDNPRSRRFVARSGGKIVFLKPADITWIKANANSVRLNVADGQSYRVWQTMQQVERRLDPNLFLRIHRSIIVNIETVRDVQRCGHGELIVTLRDGMELPLGRSFRQRLERLMA